MAVTAQPIARIVLEELVAAVMAAMEGSFSASFKSALENAFVNVRAEDLPKESPVSTSKIPIPLFS